LVIILNLHPHLNPLPSRQRQKRRKNPLISRERIKGIRSDNNHDGEEQLKN
jgi:hypothetical protein